MPSAMRLYQVVGRKAPTTEDANPTAYRMKIFAPNAVMAKSRFWYFMHQMRKMKKTTGEILDCVEIVEKNNRIVKNYGIWLRYSSRSGTHNMYREYRDVKLTGAVSQLYDEMAGRHRTRPRSIQIIRTAVVAARFKIVEGAVSMVEMALDELKKQDIVDLDEEKKAAMVSNLMVVLCSDKAAQPVVNSGTLHQ